MAFEASRQESERASKSGDGEMYATQARALVRRRWQPCALLDSGAMRFRCRETGPDSRLKRDRSHDA